MFLYFSFEHALLFKNKMEKLETFLESFLYNKP